MVGRGRGIEYEGTAAYLMMFLHERGFTLRSPPKSSFLAMAETPVRLTVLRKSSTNRFRYAPSFLKCVVCG